MNLKTDTLYRVTKGNSDGSILAGDIIRLSSRDGSLWNNCGGNQGGWLDANELTPEIMNFKAKIYDVRK